MKHYQINIISKNKKSLENFVTFVNSNLQKLQITNKYFQKKKNRKILTILKSPHVNKKAQEQFNSNLYHKSVNIYLPQYFKLITFIKTVKSNLFLDVRVKVKLIINNKLEKKMHRNIFNPTNFKLNCFSNKINYCNKKIKTKSNNLLFNNKKLKKQISKNNSFSNINKFLKILDIYGELSK
jgi:ribosomal protein S10